MDSNGLGLFYPSDYAKKKTAPEPVWLDDNYLPDYKTAVDYEYNLISDQDLYDKRIGIAQTKKIPEIVFDCECYENYFMVGMEFIDTGEQLVFEMSDQNHINLDKLRWVLETFILIGFNSNGYDLVLLAMVLHGFSTQKLKEASDKLIVDNLSPYEVLSHYDCEKLNINTIDLINIPLGKSSLKIYGGRINSKRLKDLPFDPSKILSEKQITITRWYCMNDLQLTKDLRKAVSRQLDLRVAMSNQYKIDLRSKSDAQIAETVLGKTIKEIKGESLEKINITPGSKFKYKTPDYLYYASDLMNWVLDKVRELDFCINDKGVVEKPELLTNLNININKSNYTMQIGGLHSSEKSISYYSDKEFIIVDRDVASYYPAIILNQGLYPKQLGYSFLEVYQEIVTSRLRAKKMIKKIDKEILELEEKLKLHEIQSKIIELKQQRDIYVVENEGKKIQINGSFGKLGSLYSILYSPELLIQVTISGQLSLLMLIERLELSGISVISANTDGIVIKCPKSDYNKMDEICKKWEKDTNFELEETVYKSIHSRDVNSYYAVKKDGSVKRKGAFSEPSLSVNPSATVSCDAVAEFLSKNTPIKDYIKSCKDITKFLTIRTVKGGAVKIWYEKNNFFNASPEVDYLGKTVRWYYSTDVCGDIIYANSGNKVPNSEGAKPCLVLPDEFPQDIDYDWYIQESKNILKDIGYIT